MPLTYAQIEAAFDKTGFIVRGGFRTTASEDPASKTIIMIGNAGPCMWEYFSATQASGDNPLDSWTRLVVAPRAQNLGAQVAWPSEKPYRPFQRWAVRAEPVTPSPLGILIHPEYGLWHAYRAALIVDGPVSGLPAKTEIASPCETCAGKPCLATCPVDAFTTAGYDVPVCISHMKTSLARPCHDGGCQARMACPVATNWRYSPDQRAFHAAAFFRAHR